MRFGLWAAQQGVTAGALTGRAAAVQKVPVHFGEGERLFYGQVQDAAVPIRQALAEHPEACSPQPAPAAQPAPDDSPSSPREPDCPSLRQRTFKLLRSCTCSLWL